MRLAPAGLLRKRHERPRCRATNERDEIAAPDHSITSSARARPCFEQKSLGCLIAQLQFCQSAVRT